VGVVLPLSEVFVRSSKCPSTVHVFVFCTRSSVPAAGEFLEEFLVERLTFVERSHRNEHVPADEFVHQLAVGAQTLERHFVVAVVAAYVHLRAHA